MGEQYSYRGPHDAKQAAFSEKLLADSMPANSHCARCADFTRAFDYAHAHGVRHSEENHHGDNARDEGEDRTEHSNHLVDIPTHLVEPPTPNSKPMSLTSTHS